MGTFGSSQKYHSGQLCTQGNFKAEVGGHVAGVVFSKVGLFIELQIQWCSERHCKCRSAGENNQQEIPVDCLIQIAKNFGMSVDDVIFFDEKNGVPNEVSMNDKAALEQLQLINELNEEEKVS